MIQSPNPILAAIPLKDFMLPVWISICLILSAVQKMLMILWRSAREKTAKVTAR